MITLYQLASSPFSEKVRRAFAYKKIPYEVHEVDRSSIAAGRYQQVSPTGKFPAIDHDGVAVWDSTDIILHLEAAFPDRPLTPSNPRDAAVAHVLEDWADESLYFYEITMRLAWEHNLESVLDEFTKTMPGLPREQLKANLLDRAGELTAKQGLGRKPRPQIIADVHRHLGALDAMLDGAPWLVGNAPCVADLAVISQLNALLFASEAKEALQATKNITPWMTRLDELAPAN